MIRLACERPTDEGVPLARWSSPQLAAEAVARGIAEQISGVTVWRWLSQDAIKPWQYRSWIFPRDPRFAQKAAPILDLYAGRWQGERLHPATTSSAPTRSPPSKHGGASTRRCPQPAATGTGSASNTSTNAKARYLAAWDARRAKLFDRRAPKDGIVAFDTLVKRFMSVEPYRNAQRVFVIIDTAQRTADNARSTASKAAGQT